MDRVSALLLVMANVPVVLRATLLVPSVLSIGVGRVVKVRWWQIRVLAVLNIPVTAGILVLSLCTWLKVWTLLVGRRLLWVSPLIVVYVWVAVVLGVSWMGIKVRLGCLVASVGLCLSVSWSVC